MRHKPADAFSARILRPPAYHDTVEIEAPFGEFVVEERTRQAYDGIPRTLSAIKRLAESS